MAVVYVKILSMMIVLKIILQLGTVQMESLFSLLAEAWLCYILPSPIEHLMHDFVNNGEMLALYPVFDVLLSASSLMSQSDDS